MNTHIRTVAAVSVAGVLAFGTFAPSVKALGLADLQAQVEALLAQIRSLQAQAATSSNPGVGGQTDVSVGSNAIVAVPSRVCAAFSRNLSQGMSGSDVVDLQQFLQDEGYFSAETTGYYGPVTASAVAQWQTSQGISAVGAFGPMSRDRFKIWCGNPNPLPTPTCKPLTYMPTLCASGAAPQPIHDDAGCLTGYECPVDNFSPPATCKVWNDGCNTCSRETLSSPGACTLRACFAAGKGYCMVYFDGTQGQAPTISSFTGPTTLSIGQTGTWSVQASDPQNGALSYHVTWGDEIRYPMAAAMHVTDPFVQTTTFTHVYASAGTYTIAVTVRNTAGQNATTSMTVQVGDGTIACTMEYVPVCGRPSGCTNTCPSGSLCPAYCQLQRPVTYSNACTMNAASASYLHDGACTGSEQSY